MMMAAASAVVVVVDMSSGVQEVVNLLLGVGTDEHRLPPVIRVSGIVSLHGFSIAADSHIIVSVLSPVDADLFALNIVVAVRRIQRTDEFTVRCEVDLKRSTLVAPQPNTFDTRHH